MAARLCDNARRTCPAAALLEAHSGLLESLQPGTGLDAVEVAVEVQLQEHCGMVRGPAGCSRCCTLEPQGHQVQLVDEGINDSTVLSCAMKSSRHSGSNVTRCRLCPSMYLGILISLFKIPTDFAGPCDRPRESFHTACSDCSRKPLPTGQEGPFEAGESRRAMLSAKSIQRLEIARSEAVS